MLLTRHARDQLRQEPFFISGWRYRNVFGHKYSALFGKRCSGRQFRYADASLL
jgi:hypothetical protein